MMRIKVLGGACIIGALICWHAAPATGAGADTDTVTVPRSHPHVAVAHPARPAVNPASITAEGTDDPEARPLTRSRKPAPPAAEEDSGSLVMNVAGKLALVVALILACAAAWKRYQGGLPATGPATSQPIRVSNTLSLGPQRFLHLVTVGGRQLLLGSTPQSICLIAALDEHASRVGMPGSGAETQGRWDPSAHEMALDGDERLSLASTSPEDRFEELLMRLRDLEGGPDDDRRAPRSHSEGRRPTDTGSRSRESYDRAIDSDPAADVRWSEPSRSTPWARAGEEEEAGFAGPAAGGVAEALAPGSLFRSSGRGPRAGGHA